MQDLECHELQHGTRDRRVGLQPGEAEDEDEGDKYERQRQDDTFNSRLLLADVAAHDRCPGDEGA
jgi:hypothetical protein